MLKNHDTGANTAAKVTFTSSGGPLAVSSSGAACKLLLKIWR